MVALDNLTFIAVNFKALYKFLQGMEWNPNCLQRSVQGVLSVLLSLKKNPIIRYQNFSSLARRLAENIRVCYMQILPFLLQNNRKLLLIFYF